MDVPRVVYSDLSGSSHPEASAEIRKRVEKARLIQAERLAGSGIVCNAQMRRKEIQKYCPLSREARPILHSAFDRMNLSARAYDRILKLARTIADLEGKEMLEVSHVAEAIQYRGDNLMERV